MIVAGLVRRRLTQVAAVVLVMATVYVAVTFAQVWAASRRDGAGPADAIIVLGAAQYDGEPSGALRGRLDHAVELYLAGYASVFVPTGGGQPGDRTTEGLTGYRYLRNLGVPEEQILVEVAAKDTYEALSASRAILEERGMSRALLVSDPYHNLRLEGIAREVGLDAAVSPTGSRSDVWSLGRETAAVAIGRLIGYRRLSAL